MLFVLNIWIEVHCHALVVVLTLLLALSGRVRPRLRERADGVAISIESAAFFGRNQCPHAFVSGTPRLATFPFTLLAADARTARLGPETIDQKLHVRA